MGTSGSSSETHQSLLVRLRDLSDTEAWQTFQDVYLPLIQRYCRSAGLQESDALDVTQEVLIQVTRSISAFDPDPVKGQFRGWLGLIVRRQIAQFLRKAIKATSVAGGDPPDERLATVEGEAGAGSWEADFNSHLLETAMQRVKANFDQQNWRAFELTWLEDRPAPQVAEQLGLPLATVYVAKSRVLKRLRQEILILAEDIPHLASADANSKGPE